MEIIEQDEKEAENQKKIKGVGVQEVLDELKLVVENFEPTWENLQSSKLHNAVCHTFFIVKDKEVAINWKKPLVQNSQITTKVRICQQPFAQGAMRYAFYAKDELVDQKLVAKLPKIVSVDYTIATLQKDLESIFICQHIVNEFNEKIIPFVPNTNLLLNFVHCFIYELLNEPRLKYYQVENFI